MPTKPPGTPSARTASRVTTPWRSRSWRARACARSVAAGAGCRSPATSDHRPAPAGGPARRSAPGRGRCPGRVGPDLRGGASDEGPERRERVVRDLAGPDEVPERGEEQALVGRAGGGDELRPERRARARPDGCGCASCTSPSGGSAGGCREQRRRVRAEHERDAAVVGAEGSGADPGHVAAGHERVEVGGPVAADPAGEDVGLEDRRGHGRALEPGDRVGERVDVAPRAVRALPRGEEPAERRRVDGLDLAPEQGERPPAEPAEDVGVAPFAPRAAGTELAADDARRRLRATRAPPARARRTRRAGRRPPPRGTVRGSARTDGPDLRAAGRSRP